MDESKKIGYRKLPHTMEHHLNEYHLASRVNSLPKIFMLQVHSCVSFSLTISIYSCSRLQA